MPIRNERQWQNGRKRPGQPLEKAKAMGRDDIAAMFLSRASRRINEDYPNGKRVFDDLMEKLRKEKGDAPDSAQGKCWEMLQEETDARVENVKNRIREIR